MKIQIATLLLTFFALGQAHAAVIETCDIPTQTLTELTQFHCLGDLAFAPGTVIETKGQGLQIQVDGRADFSNLTVVASADESVPVDGSVVIINVRDDVRGTLNIDERGVQDGFEGDIYLDVGATTEDFRATVFPEPREAYAGGMPLPLLSPENTLARN